MQTCRLHSPLHLPDNFSVSPAARKFPVWYALGIR